MEMRDEREHTGNQEQLSFIKKLSFFLTFLSFIE